MENDNLYCNECGESRKEKLKYKWCMAESELWECLTCDNEFQVYVKEGKDDSTGN